MNENLLESAALEQTRAKLRQRLLNEILECIEQRVTPFSGLEKHFLENKCITWRTRQKQIENLKALQRDAAEPDGKSLRVNILIQ